MRRIKIRFRFWFTFRRRVCRSSTGFGSEATSTAVGRSGSRAWNGLFYVAALRTMNPQASLSLQPMFLPFMFTSTVLMPRELMPGWMQTVSDLNPLTHLSEAARMFMTGSFNWGDLGLALGFTAGIAVVGLFAASRSFAALVRSD
jgi:ABC-2 type transport system permease protein